jgi:hypothetical protein
MTGPDSPYRRPSAKHWTLLAISVVFVAAGLLILPYERDVGIVTLAFFGPCLIVTVDTMLRKFWFRRFDALKAEIVGGVPIRASRAQAMGIALVLLLMGVIILLFGRLDSLIVWTLALLTTLLGSGLMIAALSGLIPNDYLKFDPTGITFGRARYSYMVPWDNIARLSIGKMRTNPVLFIYLHDYDGVTVDPHEKRARVLKSFAWETGWAGMPIMLRPSRYGIDLPMLLRALERYLTEPATRSELAHQLTPRTELSA